MQSSLNWPDRFGKSAKRDKLLQFLNNESLVQTLLHIVADEWNTDTDTVLHSISAVNGITDIVSEVCSVMLHPL